MKAKFAQKEKKWKTNIHFFEIWTETIFKKINIIQTTIVRNFIQLKIVCKKSWINILSALFLNSIRLKSSFEPKQVLSQVLARTWQDLSKSSTRLDQSLAGLCQNLTSLVQVLSTVFIVGLLSFGNKRIRPPLTEACLKSSSSWKTKHKTTWAFPREFLKLYFALLRNEKDLSSVDQELAQDLSSRCQNLTHDLPSLGQDLTQGFPRLGKNLSPDLPSVGQDVTIFEQVLTYLHNSWDKTWSVLICQLKTCISLKIYWSRLEFRSGSLTKFYSWISINRYNYTRT